MLGIAGVSPREASAPLVDEKCNKEEKLTFLFFGVVMLRSCPCADELWWNADVLPHGDTEALYVIASSAPSCSSKTTQDLCCNTSILCLPKSEAWSAFGGFWLHVMGNMVLGSRRYLTAVICVNLYTPGLVGCEWTAQILLMAAEAGFQDRVQGSGPLCDLVL